MCCSQALSFVELHNIVPGDEIGVVSKPLVSEHE